MTLTRVVCRNVLAMVLKAETFRHAENAEIPNPKPLPKSQTAAEIPNRCRNPKPLPKSQTAAEIPNRCRNPKPLPKSQTVAEIQNRCRNPKPLPKGYPDFLSKSISPKLISPKPLCRRDWISAM